MQGCVGSRLKDWNLQLLASAGEDPLQLGRVLVEDISASGGWVVEVRSQGRRSAVGIPICEIDFEFVRSACLEIYCLLIGAGLELSGDSHRQLTELCTCTGHHQEESAFRVVRVQLRVKQGAGYRSTEGDPLVLRAG